MTTLSLDIRMKMGAAIRKSLARPETRESMSVTSRDSWSKRIGRLVPGARVSDERRVEFARWIWKLYRLTVEDWARMWSRQKGLCALCDKAMKIGGTGPTSAQVDHDHDTKYVRGLLCQKCNRWVVPVIETLRLAGVERVLAYIQGAIPV